MALFENLFSLLRVSSWTKAIFVLLGVIYLDVPGYWPSALVAAFVFCLIASAVYIYNDLQDIAEDWMHPQKRERPLASGKVSPKSALTILVILLVSGLAISLAISIKLTAILVIYLLINLAYNHGLRNIPVCDVLCIASGFMLRILAGTIGVGLPLSWWLLLTTTLLSLFIALNKRRLEMQLGHGSSRAVLKKYTKQSLDYLIAATALGCFFTYFLYVIYARQGAFLFLITIPLAGFGLWRFTQLTEKEHDQDDPVLLFLSDEVSRLNLMFFFLLTFVALTQ